MKAACSLSRGLTVRTILNKIYDSAGVIAALLIMAICLLVSAQVVANLITKLFGTSVALTIPSYADFSGYFLAASSFMALAYTFKHGGHIRVMLVQDSLLEKASNILERIVLLVATLTASFMTCYMAQQALEAHEFGDTSPGIVAIPLFIPQFFVFLGLFVFAVSLLDAFLCSFKSNKSKADHTGS